MQYEWMNVLYSQYCQDRSCVTELVFVLLDSDVVSAVVHVNGAILGAQPHGGLGSGGERLRYQTLLPLDTGHQLLLIIISSVIIIHVKMTCVTWKHSNFKL